eukprot:TRINITY_DN2609_c0_g1_i1.p1 TRINITY_DN2609_c0_g1~~TRINITY_DN2609_c0_g1_i1.p1  ORF type:complete len:405 (+),score=88.39 TRINITY_DN2609_c0_g1_i1:61-1215(+)
MAARLLALPLLLTALACVASAQHEQDDEGSRFLEENAKKTGIQVTASGLQYQVLQSGPKDGPHPNVSSPCVCHYRGSLLSGVEFDSSYKRNSPATFKPSGVVPGWTEALQLMRPGDKWKLWLPPSLGYGSRGAGSSIPPNAVLEFELELLEVKPEPDWGEWIVDSLKTNPMLVFMGLYLIFQVYSATSGGKVSQAQLKIEDAAGLPENKQVFFSIKIGDEEPARVELELFSKSCPKTAENFRALCTGEKGKGNSGKDLAFKGSKFHRIIPGFMCQGGDFTRGNGTGGESIYGSKFADEWTNGYIAHTKPGLLSMANAGKDTNGSQFFITLAATGHLDGKHVVFGQVVDGMDVVKKMAAVGSGSGTPSKSVTIVDCGEVKSTKSS